MKAKIGQEIEFKRAHKISLAKGGKANIKPGDKARVVKKIDSETGEIVYLTGEAKGLSQIITIEVDDTINTDDILKKLMNELNR